MLEYAQIASHDHDLLLELLLGEYNVLASEVTMSIASSQVTTPT